MIANPLIGSLWTGSRRDAGHLDYCQQLLTIRGNSRALYLWTERPIAPSFQQKSESFQSTDCDCGQSTDNLGVLPSCAAPIARRIPLRVSLTTKWRLDEGESLKPAAWWALVMAVRRRVIVAAASDPARSEI
jgi:hypothetical protein